jgi:hypothetical protein
MFSNEFDAAIEISEKQARRAADGVAQEGYVKGSLRRIR